MNKSIKHDHDYIYVCDSVVSRIAFAQGALRNRQLLTNCSWNWKGSEPKMLFLEDKQQRPGRNVVDKFLKTDVKIRTYAGLPNKNTFNNLVKYVTQK